jgi:hypothetical protein
MLFYSKWQKIFEDSGESTDEKVVAGYVKGCVKGYNEAFGK